MASFSRSGETLLLRCLDAHPNLHVVHQIRETDRECDLALAKFLMRYKPTTIPHDHPLIKACDIAQGATIILKNAAWTHAHPFDGFILARNPLSVIRSFKVANESEQKRELRRAQLTRWAKGINPDLLPSFAEADNIELICTLYNAKMGPLLKIGLPIVRYEDFVANPARILQSLLRTLEIPWDDAVLRSHEKYAVNTFGHGHIKLWLPIHKDSLLSWRKNLTACVIARVFGITSSVMTDYGYSFRNGVLTVSPPTGHIVG